MRCMLPGFCKAAAAAVAAAMVSAIAFVPSCSAVWITAVQTAAAYEARSPIVQKRAVSHAAADHLSEPQQLFQAHRAQETQSTCQQDSSARQLLLWRYKHNNVPPMKADDNTRSELWPASSRSPQ
eukprot:GHUV01041066.1.p3 GENE.GHUV01041066.1~~GHUV01041066.1.p3  ORF type:complete len:125 (-),score=34.79 GHUV01041066.1:251-625(-)